MKISTILTWSVSALLLMMVFCPAASAAGLGMSGSVTVDDAAAGGVYERIFTIHNPDNTVKYVNVDVRGPSASWVTLCDYNTMRSLERVWVAPGGYTHIIAVIDIPPSAADGIHKANIIINEPGSFLSLELNVPVIINIGDNAIIPDNPAEPPHNDVPDPRPPVQKPDYPKNGFIRPGNSHSGHDLPWYMR